MTIDQNELAQSILDGFVELDDGVPADFAEFVQERIAARPSPAQTEPVTLESVNDKLDAILALLRGGNPE